MVEIRRLTNLNSNDLDYLVTGYTSNAKYRVTRTQTERQIAFILELVPLSQAYTKHYDHIATDTLEHYQWLPSLGFSFGAYDDQACIGLTLAEPRHWNRSLWVWELHVAKNRRRQGIGRQLIEVLAQNGQAAGLRTVVCETQNTNTPAIYFYHKMGFFLEGIDLSYYSNDDFPDGEIALFMKKRLV